MENNIPKYLQADLIAHSVHQDMVCRPRCVDDGFNMYEMKTTQRCKTCGNTTDLTHDFWQHLTPEEYAQIPNDELEATNN